MPVLSWHCIGDATVFVEGNGTLRQRMLAAINRERQVQTSVDSAERSQWGDEHYLPLIEALLNWVEESHAETSGPRGMPPATSGA